MPVMRANGFNILNPNCLNMLVERTSPDGQTHTATSTLLMPIKWWWCMWNFSWLFSNLFKMLTWIIKGSKYYWFSPSPKLYLIFHLLFHHHQECNTPRTHTIQYHQFNWILNFNPYCCLWPFPSCCRRWPLLDALGFRTILPRSLPSSLTGFVRVFAILLRSFRSRTVFHGVWVSFLWVISQGRWCRRG